MLSRTPLAAWRLLMRKWWELFTLALAGSSNISTPTSPLPSHYELLGNRTLPGICWAFELLERILLAVHSVLATARFNITLCEGKEDMFNGQMNKNISNISLLCSSTSIGLLKWSNDYEWEECVRLFVCVCVLVCVLVCVSRGVCLWGGGIEKIVVFWVLTCVGVRNLLAPSETCLNFIFFPSELHYDINNKYIVS